MRYDMVRYERGQVWMIRFKNPEQVGHEQSKDRPWLILSVGKFNASSGMVTAAAITTRDEIRTPSQVKFTNWYGKDNVIMCESIRTFDYSSNNYIFEYLGQVSNDVLEQVDVALSVHLGMHYSPITLSNLYETMEAIFKSVGHMQEAASTPKFTDDDVIQFTQRMQELAGINTTQNEISATNQYISPLEVYRGTIISEEEEVEYEKATRVESTEETHIENSESRKTTRISWTPELCREFMKDAETLPLKQVMNKWNISKKTRFYSMKNYVRNLLEKTTK